MKQKIKQLFCIHRYKQAENHAHLSILKFECSKCGKVGYWL
jgi:hypothetical protein